MGTWATGIYADDEAQDAREAYREILSEGLEGPAATDRFLKEWKQAMKDSDDGPVIWFALADTQWSLGRLEKRVRDAAIRIINDGSSLDRWKEAGAKLTQKRQQVLLKLKEKLLSPQPPVKKITLAKAPPPPGSVLTPAQLRSELKRLYCSVEPSRGGPLTAVTCRSGLTDALLEAIVNAGSQLERLSITDGESVTDVGISAIGRLLGLEELILRGCNKMSDAGLAQLENLKDLVSLEVSRNRQISDAAAARLANCRHLTNVDLCGTAIGDPSTKVLSGLARLERLWLRGTRITDKGSAPLAKLKKLRQLYICNTAIGDKSMLVFAALPKLVWLDVAGTSITDKGVEILSRSKSLQALDLAQTKISDRCLPSLLKLQKLCYLNVEQTKISKNGLMRLESGLPKLNDDDARQKLY